MPGAETGQGNTNYHVDKMRPGGHRGHSHQKNFIEKDGKGDEEYGNKNGYFDVSRAEA